MSPASSVTPMPMLEMSRQCGAHRMCRTTIRRVVRKHLLYVRGAAQVAFGVLFCGSVQCRRGGDEQRWEHRLAMVGMEEIGSVWKRWELNQGAPHRERSARLLLSLCAAHACP